MQEVIKSSLQVMDVGGFKFYQLKVWQLLGVPKLNLGGICKLICEERKVLVWKRMQGRERAEKTENKAKETENKAKNKQILQTEVAEGCT